MKHSVTVSVNVPSSFAVDQVRGMFPAGSDPPAVKVLG
jgi:hypothetical protein